MSNDVAIVGIGMHPFGRHEISGMEQGAIAVRTACADAGINWQDVQFAVGGSMAAGNPDRMVSMLGLTGLQFCLLYTSPSPRDKRQSRMPSSA